MFEIKESKIGELLLSDGAKIAIRLSIYDVTEERIKPVGPDVSIGQSITISVIDSPYKEAVKNKPLPPEDGSHLTNLDIWEIIDIKSYTEAAEVVLFKASDGNTYEITVKIIPSIVARTLEYRDNKGYPIYFVRWFSCGLMRLIRRATNDLQKT